MPLWVVICREDPCPENGRGKFTVPTGKLFREEARAIRYIGKIDRDRDPMIGRVTHHQLTYAANDFEDLTIARDSVDTENVPIAERRVMVDPSPAYSVGGVGRYSSTQRGQVRVALMAPGQTPDERERLRDLSRRMGMLPLPNSDLPPMVDMRGREIAPGQIEMLVFDEPEPDEWVEDEPNDEPEEEEDTDEGR